MTLEIGEGFALTLKELSAKIKYLIVNTYPIQEQPILTFEIGVKIPCTCSQKNLF